MKEILHIIIISSYFQLQHKINQSYIFRKHITEYGWKICNDGIM